MVVPLGEGNRLEGGDWPYKNGEELSFLWRLSVYRGGEMAIALEDSLVRSFAEKPAQIL